MEEIDPPQKERRDTNMTNSKLNARSANRIEFHLNSIEKRKLLLQKYPVGSAGFERTMNAMDKDFAVIAEVESKLGMRQEQQLRREELLASMPAKTPGKRGPKGPVGPRKGEFFSIELGDDLVGYNDNDGRDELSQAV